MFQVVIENRTTHADVSILWLAKVAKALTRQLARDLCPSYGKALWSVTASNDKVTPGLRVVLFDDGDQAGVLGYHDVGPDGTPYAKVFTAGLPLDEISQTLSHEILELVVDPDAGGYRFARGSTRGYADEACDAVQGAGYRIDDVMVSNFVLPSWYVTGAKGPVDFLGLLPGPGAKTDEGYLIIREADGTVDTDPPEAKELPGKAHPASRTARRLAAGGVDSSEAA
jgi:hypothetical protein